MYNPCRGGVRGGADQFTWESVKTDKHRENYLGHSLKAPVGRWQKGKDLSWYAKERKNDDEGEKTEQSERAAIKRAEEEAMLIALGHKVTRKESQPVLSKADMTEALKRNIGDRDDHNIERIDGVGSSSRRAALMAGVNKDSRSRSEGVMFASQKLKKANDESTREESPSHKRSRAKKKSKKHRKEKKAKHSSDDTDSDESTSRRKHKKHKRDYDSHRDTSPLTSKEKHRKRSKHKHQNSSSSEIDHHKSSKRRLENHKSHETLPRKRHRHDTSESD